MIIIRWLFGMVAMLAVAGCRNNAEPPPELADSFALRNLEAPARKAHQGRELKRPSAPVLPELPEGFENAPALTAVTVVEVVKDGTHQTFVRHITRGEDKVNVRYERQGQEWLFLRNPVDFRRTTGRLVDHRRKEILTYFESDLADAGVARGWAEVMMLGVSKELIVAMRPSGETIVKDGITYHRYLRDARTPKGESTPDEVWWSESYLLPLEIVRRTKEETWTQRIVNVDFDVRAAVLSEPAERFPSYETMDIADWADCEADKDV